MVSDTAATTGARSTTVVDFGRTVADYAQHRQGFPPEFFRRLAHFDIPLPGQRLLDIGTGTGLLARAFALRGARVTGLDQSLALLTAARKQTEEARLDVTYIEATAEHTGLPDAGFDVVTAATCWHWFDRHQAAREAFRLLESGGRLLIAALDCAGGPDSVGRLSWDLAKKFNPVPEAPVHTFLFPAWANELLDAGFADYEAFAFTTPLSYDFEAWCGRMRASNRIGASLSADKVAEFDALHRRELAARFGTGQLLVDHRIFAIIARKA